MTLENTYLIINNYDKIRSYEDESIKIELTSYGKDSFITRLKADEDSVDNAILLSRKESQIRNEVKLIIIRDECSQFFSQLLFPLFNSFENNMKELIILNLASQNDDKLENNIKKLKEMSLAEIFTKFFTSENFANEVKKKINSANYISKSEILKEIQEIEEKTFWDKYLLNEKVPTLKPNFEIIRNYRNKVMHAGHINEEEYKNAKRLLNEINNELEVAIDNICNNIDEGQKESNMNINLDFSNLFENSLMPGINIALQNITKDMNITDELSNINFNLLVDDSAFESINKVIIEMANELYGDQLREMANSIIDLINNKNEG